MSVINTNYLSLVAQNNLQKSQSALGTAIERLSSGLRINSAKDDAAGQAIANRMGSQINGLNQAARNANDGISAAQTTEGALNQINDNLQRVRVLTVQAANSTNSAEDRTSIQGEIEQRLGEIDRISRETEFNGVKVLASEQTLKIQVGANDGQTIEIELSLIDSNKLGLGTFNVDGSGAKPNDAATADSLTLAGFSKTGTVDGSDRYERTTTDTNNKAAASDVVSRMATNDTLVVAGANNGLGTAVGDTYTYDAGTKSFSFDVNDVSSTKAASFLMPAAGTTKEATITLGGTAQDVLIDSTGNISSTDNKALYLDNSGNLTLNGGDKLARATVENVTARMAAPATAVPTTSVTAAGANESNKVTFAALALGESVTVGGLTYTSSAGDAGADIAAKFAAYDPDDALTTAGFSGALDDGWTMGAAAGADLTLTSTNPGNPTNVSTSTLGVASAPAGALVTQAAGNATPTETTVTFGDLTIGQKVTVNGVTFEATAATVTKENLAAEFKSYFEGGSGTNGTFTPVSGDVTGFTVVDNTDGTITFTLDTKGALPGITASGDGSVAAVSTTGSNAVAAKNEVTFSGLAAGEQFTLTATGGKAVTLTANATMTADDVAAAFASALADQDALDADTRFSGSWSFTGANGWTVDSSSGTKVTLANQDAGEIPNATALTTSSRAAGTAPTVAQVVATPQKTEVTFGDLSAGQGVTVNGLTLTAKDGMTAADVATAFQQKTTGSYEGSAATFTGSFGSDFEVTSAGAGVLEVTAKIPGVSSAVAVSTPAAVGGGDIKVGGTTLTVDGNSFDVTGASISAGGLLTEAAGKAATIAIAAGDAAGSYSVATNGDVSGTGGTLYVAGDALTTDVTSQKTDTYFAHSNGNITDGAGNRIYKDAAATSGFSTNATSPGDATEDPLALLDDALATVDSLRSNLGAIQNRFQSAIQNLTTTSTNLAAAQSRIQDADYAVEVANMTRAQILQQAGTSVLAQANQIPQGVLSLLR